MIVCLGFRNQIAFRLCSGIARCHARDCNRGGNGVGVLAGERGKAARAGGEEEKGKA